MKKLLLSLVIFLSIPFLSVAQEDSLPVVYRTWITVNNNLQRIEGILYGIKDSSIFITNSFSRTDCLSGNFSGTTIGYNFINNVKVRRNNSVIVGSFLGAAVGFGTGAIIGASQGDDPPCQYICIFQMTAGEKALFNGTLCTIPGAIIGALIGGIKIKIPINGSIQTFNKNKERLRKYSFIR